MSNLSEIDKRWIDQARQRPVQSVRPELHNNPVQRRLVHKHRCITLDRGFLDICQRCSLKTKRALSKHISFNGLQHALLHFNGRTFKYTTDKAPEFLFSLMKKYER
jgi:hypothetical protein